MYLFQFASVVRSFLCRMNPDVYIVTGDESTSDNHQRIGLQDNEFSNNIIPTLAVIETNSLFFIVQPYIPCSLWDIVSYSPAVFDTSHAKSLFVLYQVLKSMLAFHRVGLSVGKLTLDSIRVDDKLWVYCTHPSSSCFIEHKTDPKENTKRSGSTLNIEKTDSEDSDVRTVEDLNESSVPTGCSSKGSESSGSEYSLPRRISQISESDNYLTDAIDVMEQFQVLNFETSCLAKLTEDWVQHKITNFRYLMYLNHLAGRRLGDPNHHPVLPWIMDFTSSHSGLRELSLSKFRLNKGESQLDFTFEAMKELGGDSEHIPHHVSDVLSDITYYVYKARRTPKHLLCTYVRTKWVPNEYPHNLERMYQWTPDECIPEFFTDPSIFTSIHEDLPDLELPTWCTSAAEFIERHNAMLESEQISCRLHEWIDLTFGFKVNIH